MRIRRKVYREQVLSERSDLLVDDPTIYQGNWKKLLNCDNLHVEIGSGKGEYWRQMAKQYPTSGWVGIERNLNIAAIALNKTEVGSLDNARFIANNAQALETWFANDEIDCLHLNFSDPWPKRAHEKRRLTYSSFLDVYRKLLSKDGLIIMKTDNQGLMEFSLNSLKENGYKLLENSSDFRAVSHDEDAITEYEAKFMALGQPIYRAIWQVVK